MVLAEDVAQFLISLSNTDEENFMTNLRINKLLYFIQGYHLARTNTPLFEDDFEAWQYGPVIPKIYDKYKYCGHNPIINDDYKDIEFQKDELITISDVLKEYGKYTTSALISITHEPNSAWDITVKNENKIIEKKLIKEEFSKKEIPTFLERLSKIPSVSKLPKDWA